MADGVWQKVVLHLVNGEGKLLLLGLAVIQIVVQTANCEQGPARSFRS